MLLPRGLTKGDRSLDERWHEKAREVKRSVANVDLLPERDIARWDLDDPERRPTGKKVPSNWEYDKPLKRVNEGDEPERRVDARDDPTIRDGTETE